MNNDLKSCEALKAYAREVLCGNNPTNSLLIRMFDEIIDNAQPAEPEKVLIANVTFDEDKLKEIVQTEVVDKIKSGELVLKDERTQGELKEYKPLELDYNVKSAVENLKTAYWNNDTEKYAKAFTEAEEIIINAICHHGYIVCKRTQGEWIANPLGDYVCNKCSWVIGKFERNFCCNCGAKMKGGAEE